MSPKIIAGLVLTVFVLSLLPLALIARSRASRSPNRAIHLVLDMDKQPRFDPQSRNAMYEDGMAMRPQVKGTVAREDLTLKTETLTVSDAGPRSVGGTFKKIELTTPEQYAAVMHGRVRAAGTDDAAFAAAKPPTEAADMAKFYVSAYPVDISDDFMARGRERFNIYCAPCHGQTGYGDGMIQRRVVGLQTSKPDAVALWTPPANLTTGDPMTRPVGHIYNTITNGIRNMPAYDKQISVLDRWAIVAYVKSLQERVKTPATAPAK
jgi:mono/diheme cytochrome c family protein